MALLPYDLAWDPWKLDGLQTCASYAKFTCAISKAVGFVDYFSPPSSFFLPSSFVFFVLLPSSLLILPPSFSLLPRKTDEGRRKKEGGRRMEEGGRRKKEEGRRVQAFGPTFSRRISVLARSLPCQLCQHPLPVAVAGQALRWWT